MFWLLSQIDMDDMLLEELAPVGTVPMPPNLHLEEPSLQVMAPVQEPPVPDAWIPQAGPQDLNYSTDGECQSFLDPGKTRTFLLVRCFFLGTKELRGFQFGL